MADKPNSVKRLYKFGEFCVDADSGTLRRNGEIVVLPPRVFNTLRLLVERHREVLTKSEMLDEIWKDTFVEEGNLTQNIYLLRRALGKMPDGREWIETIPRKGYVFVGEINKNLDNGGIEAAPSEGSRLSVREFSTAAKGALAFLFLILLSAGAFFAYTVINSRADKTFSGQNISLKKLSFSGDVEFPVISPDGNLIAYTRNGHLFLQPVASDSAREITLPEKTEAGFSQFTPDSRFIAFRDKRRTFLAGNIYQVSIDGGNVEPIAPDVWSGFSFSPDGKFLTFVRVLPEENRQALILRDRNKGTERTLSELIGPSAFILVASPSFSADASKIAIAITKQEAQTPRSQLSVYDVASGGVEEFAPPQLRQFEQAVWLPDGKSIAVIGRENQKFFQVWALSYPLGRLSHITNDLISYRSLSISADGRKMVSANFTTFSHIWTAPAEDLNAQKQTTFGNLNRDGTIGMAWLPDKSIVYSSRVFGNVDLWRAGPNELDKAQLTRETGDINAYPFLAADGSTIYFTSNRTGTTQIWKMDVNKPSEQTQLTSGDKEVNEFPQVSPDGAWLYFLKKAKNEAAIWRRSLTNGAEAPVEIDGKISPSTFLELSPDGKYLAACDLGAKTEDGGESQTFQIAVVSTEHRAKPRIFSMPSQWIVWSMDSNGFEFADNNGGSAKLWHQGLEAAAPRSLFELKGEYIAAVRWSPDGKTLAISRGKRLNDAVLITNF